MARSIRKKRKTFSDINITPLTDIFLVLLIIMMVIAPLLDQQGLNLAVPSSQEVENPPKESKVINVNVSDEGKYLIDDKAVEEGNLIFAIQDEMKIKKEGLLIQASENSTHGAVVKVMDAARNAGVTNISIAD